jgi:hypothetical protein
MKRRIKNNRKNIYMQILQYLFVLQHKKMPQGEKKNMRILDGLILFHSMKALTLKRIKSQI